MQNCDDLHEPIQEQLWMLKAISDDTNNFGRPRPDPGPRYGRNPTGLQSVV
jgi:hypothetical protein